MHRERARPSASRAAIRRRHRLWYSHCRERGAGAVARSRRSQEQGRRSGACVPRHDRSQTAIWIATAMTEAAPASSIRGGAERRRSVARLLAVQALYQIEINRIDADGGAAIDAVVAEFVKHRLGQEIEGENYGEADRPPFADKIGRASRREKV